MTTTKRPLVQYIARYDGQDFIFDTGMKVAIFYCGVENNMYNKKGGVDTLLKYVDVVYDCYIEDESGAPFGRLCDFVAEKWNKITKDDWGYYEILEAFNKEGLSW